MERAKQLAASDQASTPKPTCQQSLTLTFFFDGTGNNLKADEPTNEHSNVARLFLSHPLDRPSDGLYSFYIPGIGTYFPEIGDPGGTMIGMAFGGSGQARLDWALQQFDEKLAYHLTLAQNPTNKITLIRVAAFGFSRGATLARAFAREFQKRCEASGASWRLKSGGYPVRFYFLGLWDTVASVGLPMSANNTPLAQSLDWISAARSMQWRDESVEGVRTLAFGKPGADPAPGLDDGHMSWAHPLDVPPMIERCVHMVAAHEIRNSFPLDSCRRGNAYPSCVEEMVYPGVHSDVGGGYRAGEGARSALPGQMLSLIPLRAMHQKAREGGVPLIPLGALGDSDPRLPPYFALDDACQTEFTKLQSLWLHYMQQAGMGGRPLGDMFNAHMRLYYAWRFHKIRKNDEARAQGEPTADESALASSEKQWAQERDALQRQMAPAKAAMMAAQAQAERARNRLMMARRAQDEFGQPVDPALQQAADDAQARAEQASNPYLQLKARYDTLPGTQGQLAKNLQVYDRQLMYDAQAIYETHCADPSLPLRPHYKALLDAYLAEFPQSTNAAPNGLKDERIIEFFDTYVHDSLAGFARDATLPSDPRVVYIGDDDKDRYADLSPMVQPDDEAMAA
jgi:hypothetical protein